MRFFQRKPKSREKQKQFLGHDELAYVRKLRKEGKFDQVENILKSAIASPAVLDELRKTASIRAREAEKEGDWQSVVQYLEGYNAYANKHRKECIRQTNQEPPGHTQSDLKRLQEAKAKLTMGRFF